MSDYITPAEGVVRALLGICQLPLRANATGAFGSD
jgi:hypothetical protein